MVNKISAFSYTANSPIVDSNVIKNEVLNHDIDQNKPKDDSDKKNDLTKIVIDNE